MKQLWGDICATMKCIPMSTYAQRREGFTYELVATSSRACTRTKRKLLLLWLDRTIACSA